MVGEGEGEYSVEVKSSCEVDRIPEEPHRPRLGTNPIGHPVQNRQDFLFRTLGSPTTDSLSLSLCLYLLFISSPVSPRLAIVNRPRLFYSIHIVFQILYRLGALPIILLLG